MIILTTGLAYPRKIIRFAKDAKRAVQCPKARQGSVSSRMSFVSLLYITDTGRNSLRGMLSVYQDEYLTGLGGDSNRGVTILENLLCVCHLEPFPFF